MCGIAGITGGGRREALARMVRAMQHRGPDDHGDFVTDDVALGMTRLSIIDPTSAGHQPMRAADGPVWIVYNGETFNFRDERRRLESHRHRFRSHSDTEVVLELYRRDGLSCVRRLRGMFAFAIWDEARRALVLARDRIGIKPLYYAILPDGELLFASEIKVLAASGLIEPQIDRHALRSLLTYGSVTGPRTIVRGVSMLPAGHTLEFQRGRISIEKYWDLPTRASASPPAFEEAAADLRDRLRDVVRLALESDVDLGVFLSAGVDSAAVLALMADLGHRQVSTYCVGFDDNGPSARDEMAGAEATARFFGARFHPERITGSDVDAAFDRFVWALDQPSVDGLNTYMVSRAAGPDVKVALSGLGGDELFGGYGRTAQSFWRSRSLQGAAGRTLLRGWRLANGGDSRGWRGRVDHRLAAHDPLESYTAARSLFPNSTVDALLEETSEPQDFRAFDTAPDADAVLRTAILDLRTFVPFQLLRDMDAVAMANSVEVRFPLLDHELVSWALALPAAYKYAPRERPVTFREEEFTYETSGAKRVFLAAMEGLLPPELPKRRKQGFKLPMTSWLNGPLKARAHAALDAAGDSVVSRDAAVALKQEFEAGRAPWSHVWLLLVLEGWQRAIPVAGAAAISHAAR